VTIGADLYLRLQIVGIAHLPEKDLRKGVAYLDFSNAKTVMEKLQYLKRPNLTRHLFFSPKERVFASQLPHQTEP
jgi:hypothetical protein